MTDFSVLPLAPYEQRETVLALARENSAATDADARSPFDTLRQLADAGLTTLGRSGSLLPQAAVIFDLATECTATAFSLWAHRAVIAFFDAVGRDLPEGIATARRTASTAMAAAFKNASGVGDLGVHAVPVEGGLSLTGTISWASNLYPGGLMVLPIALAGQEPGKAIAAITVDAPGVEVKYQKGLLALDATESGIIKLTDVFVPSADILSTDVPSFLASITAPFLLLQSSLCLGLGASALASTSTGLTTAQGIFEHEFAEVTAEYERLRTQLITLAEDPSKAQRYDLLRLRLDAAHLATHATRLEMAVIGGRGYKTSSATGRRYREASFLPVQSPTEGHLRYELSRYEQATA